MIVLRKNKVLYVDVDRTLIMWEKGDKWHCHKLHIELLKQFKYQGHGVVVWSAGGWQWAEKAVLKLGIQSVVDLVINKPDWWVDDLTSGSVLPEHTHIFLADELALTGTVKKD